MTGYLWLGLTYGTLRYAMSHLWQGPRCSASATLEDELVTWQPKNCSRTDTSLCICPWCGAAISGLPGLGASVCQARRTCSMVALGLDSVQSIVHVVVMVWYTRV